MMYILPMGCSDGVKLEKNGSIGDKKNRGGFLSVVSFRFYSQSYGMSSDDGFHSDSPCLGWIRHRHGL